MAGDPRARGAADGSKRRETGPGLPPTRRYGSTRNGSVIDAPVYCCASVPPGRQVALTAYSPRRCVTFSVVDAIPRESVVADTVWLLRVKVMVRPGIGCRFLSTRIARMSLVDPVRPIRSPKYTSSVG